MTLKYLSRTACAASLALFISAPFSSATILLSAENFALLGGTAITGSGVAGTIIRNGDVGLSPGATSGITGFPPAVIENGAIIATGPVTGQARLDLIKAQVGLAGMPSDKTLSNIDLGGKTLRPGVYTFGGAAKLTGDLVLDARGRNGAFWVFQIGTALTTTVNSTVTLINPGSNGGRDCGIFWNAGSGITIGANNHIAGNYLAGTSITFGAKSSGGGHALARAGISLDNNQIDAIGGPGVTGWSRGLKYDASGAVVPNPALSFGYSGERIRTIHTGSISIRGDATVTAADIQWRVNGGLWQTAEVGYGGKWQFGVSADSLAYGSNKIDVRARDSHGGKTAIKQLIIRRPR
ncbi:MAG: ice-binding family protein [Luteolibacter sp.]|uniref:ice-binding family protein n=1 Tax=Luteolibacter sp. TaxID=1962973 RepID=UPI003263FF46